MYRPIIRNLYCVMRFDVTSDVQVNRKSNVWVGGKINFHIYCGNCEFRKKQSDPLRRMGHLLEKMMS